MDQTTGERGSEPIHPIFGVNSMKVYELLNQVTHCELPSDKALSTTCDQCGEKFTLADCVVEETSETRYSCPECRAALVIIGALEEKPLPERGYRFELQGVVLRNGIDLWFELHGARLCLDRKPHALDGGSEKKQLAASTRQQIHP